MSIVKSKLILSALCVVVVVVAFASIQLIMQFQSVKAQTVQYRLSGWIYSGTYDWISLNSDNLNSANCLPPQCNDTGVEYSVILQPNNTISGFGWSSNVGWICFGTTCAGSAPDGSTASASLDPATGRISGWAQVLSLGNNGWIHFQGSDVPGTFVGQACYGCKKTCSIWTQKCDTKGVCTSVEPCLLYDETKFDSCSTCFTATYFDGAKIPSTESETVVGGSGNSCSTCTECAVVKGAAGDSGRVQCQKCSGCKKYSVSSDLDDGSLYGWGWNSFLDGTNTFGAGWIHFNNTFGGPVLVYPWLETQYGAIYSQGGVRQRAGTARENATYCIFAKDIQRVRSGICNLDVIKDVDILGTSGQVYKNALGKIDIDGLTRPINGIMNKYRQRVVNISSQSQLTQPLDDKVYVTSGDLTINTPLTFNNAPIGDASSGNGTIIVKGNLIIKANINYGTTSASDSVAISNDLKKLASVGWIVQGDVVVDTGAGSITNVSGAFLVLGNNSACMYANDTSCNSATDYPQYKQNGYGTFFSGAASNSLTVWGLIVAKAFDFRRTFADAAQGSERIIYDGRITANPPPGLSSFTEGLPVIRDFAY